MSPGPHSLFKQMVGSTPAKDSTHGTTTRQAGRILHASMIEFRVLVCIEGNGQFHKFNVGKVCTKFFGSDFSIALQQIEFSGGKDLGLGL